MSSDEPDDDQTGREPEVSNFPRLESTFRDDGSVELVVQGVSRVFPSSPDDQMQDSAQDRALRHLHGVAQGVGRPVRVHTFVPGREAASLIVTAAGRYYDESNPDRSFLVPPAPDGRDTSVVDLPSPASDPTPVEAAPAEEPNPAPEPTDTTTEATEVAQATEGMEVLETPGSDEFESYAGNTDQQKPEPRSELTPAPSLATPGPIPGEEAVDEPAVEPAFAPGVSSEPNPVPVGASVAQLATRREARTQEARRRAKRRRQVGVGAAVAVLAAGGVAGALMMTGGTGDEQTTAAPGATGQTSSTSASEPSAPSTTATPDPVVPVVRVPRVQVSALGPGVVRLVLTPRTPSGSRSRPAPAVSETRSAPVTVRVSMTPERGRSVSRVVSMKAKGTTTVRFAGLSAGPASWVVKVPGAEAATGQIKVPAPATTPPAPSAPPTSTPVTPSTPAPSSPAPTHHPTHHTPVPPGPVDPHHHHVPPGPTG